MSTFVLQDPIFRAKMIAMRLHRDTPFEGQMVAEQLTTVVTSKEVVVLTVKNDEVVMLRDGIDLFPSDTLISALRLLFN
jgi:hypothetical protein